MSMIDRLRQKFIDGGFPVSHRDDIGIAAMAWYFSKAEKTLRNTPIAYPRATKVAGSRRYRLEDVMRYELERADKAA